MSFLSAPESRYFPVVNFLTSVRRVLSDTLVRLVDRSTMILLIFGTTCGSGLCHLVYGDTETRFATVVLDESVTSTRCGSEGKMLLDCFDSQRECSIVIRHPLLHMLGTCYG